jgi:hypothetical protein
MYHNEFGVVTAVHHLSIRSIRVEGTIGVDKELKQQGLAT